MNISNLRIILTGSGTFNFHGFSILCIEDIGRVNDLLTTYPSAASTGLVAASLSITAFEKLLSRRTEIGVILCLTVSTGLLSIYNPDISDAYNFTRLQATAYFIIASPRHLESRV